MKSYIFITTEGYTFQPDSDFAEPDIENCQVVGFGKGNDAPEAFENMLKGNDYLLETNFNEVFCLQLRNEERTYFYIDDYKDSSENGGCK
ncbi:MAG: hypothetical protein L6246_00055 [Thermodesulfovibrionales bacterium]|nr:hypothetical protein [Nitrospinota bacterium]MBU4509708.1 hypothetical protein [bacterium]MCG2708707.1 hypothetical protein [Thermodesulfovibrionales bacterium]